MHEPLPKAVEPSWTMLGHTTSLFGKSQHVLLKIKPLFTFSVAADEENPVVLVDDSAAPVKKLQLIHLTP